MMRGDEKSFKKSGPAAAEQVLRMTSVLRSLSANAVDDQMNITISNLGILSVDEVSIEYSAASIQDRVASHVHMLGAETYVILRGVGLMHVGEVKATGNVHSVAWEDPIKVAELDVFTIPAGWAHSLENKGSDPLTIFFLGSPRNLTTDRIIVKGP